MLLITLLLTYRGISQTASDSVTCIPNSQLKKAISLIELGKVHKEELDASNIKIGKLESLILTKDGIIGEYKKKDSYNDSLIVAYKGIVQNYQKTISNSEEAFSLQTKKLRREKLKKWGTLVLGVATGFLIFK